MGEQPAGSRPVAVSRRIVPDTRRRDLLVALGAGLAVLGFVVYAIFALGQQANASGGLEGIIVRKEFVSQPETQVTVGRGGVNSRQIAGEYILRVRVPQEGDKVYRIYVDRTVYEAKREGERYYFVRPGEG